MASLDDAEQFADSSMYVNSSDLELIHDTSDQTVGMRWVNLAIPKGATITAAWIQFSAKESQSEVTNLNFRAQAADAAPTFSSSRYNIGARPRTSSVVTWSPVPWNAGEVGANQKTPDLKSIIQEVVSRPGWALNNPLVIIVDGTGHRTAWAWDGSTLQAPLLHVEYTGGTPPPDLPPTAALSVTQSASPPLTVSASAVGSTDTDATPIASYSFDWGDGTTATVVNAPTQTASHTYASAGTYTVTLTVKDTGGLTSTPKTQRITVSSVDQPPVAALAVTQVTTPLLTVSASAAGSTDTDTTPIASYSFDFGDGSAAAVVNAPAQTATHTYAAAGTYTVTLAVKDTGGLTSTPKTQSITVAADNAPVGSLAVTQSASPPLTVSATAAGSTDTDAWPIASYSFDFGDGTAATVVNAPALTASHTYAAAGSYTVTLTVKDTGGLVSAPKTQSIVVAAADNPPVAALTVTQSANPPLTVSADATGSTDADATPIASYSFDFGDGTAATVVNAPALTASHTYAAAGTYTVTLTVKDTGGLTSTPKTQSIVVSAPVAPTTVEARVAASSDDDEQQADGSQYLNSSDLELIHDSTDQIVGMRWTGLAIPPGATISTAWIQFASKETWSDPTSLTLRAQAADNPTTFTSATNNVSSRPMTNASTTWVPVPWNAGEVGANQRTPDLRAPVQEVVSRAGWASGNALAFIVSGTGHRDAWAWDGNAPLAPLLHVEYTTNGSQPPPTDNPPVAKLAVTPAASPPLTVTASAVGSTDTDATPIASYSFTFGDGTAAVVTDALTQTASHTYASAGTYTVTLTAKDTGGLTSAPVTQSITMSTADQPPVAKLAVSQAASPPLTVTASAAGSTDSDATPIASYSFDFGDGTAAVVLTAPAQTTTHTYSAAGSYTVTLTAKDTGGLTSAPVTANITVTSPTSGNVAVYVGYYDTHHPSNLKPKPSPWLGSSGVTFVGKDDDGKGNWDSCGLRVDNLTGADMTNVVVTCDIGSNHYALWGTRTIPANGKLILAQTAFQNFDGSDTSPAGCYGCDPKLCLTKVVSTIPVIHVAAGGTTTNYYDNTQVLNTKGADGAGCPDTGGTRNDESQQWKQLGTTQSFREGGPENENWVPEQMTFDAPAPNPVRDWMVIRYSLPRASRVFVGFYDVAGRLVQIVLDREMPAGIYQQGVTLGGVKPGVYYAQVQTSYGSLHRPVVVSR